MSTSPYTFRMDDELRHSLEAEAKLEDRPPAQLAARAIKAMVQAKAAKRDAIDAALSDAEQGAFISQDAMNRWIESWSSDDELPIPEADIHAPQS